uniref:hypothetical protein n=1 Tax=Ramaria rubella TaxID=113071 RepID=UPI0022375B1C|nr:hypothetical protein OQ044_mgp15 [Ramaria rubella]UYR22218.1 hypothetical protein [Ramaria rubella]
MREVLGVSKTVIPRYLNIFRYFCSLKLGIKVRVQELGVSNINLGKAPFCHRVKINSSPIDYDLTSLSVGRIYALKEDRILLNDKGFKSVGEAVKEKDLDKFKILSASGNR